MTEEITVLIEHIVVPRKRMRTANHIEALADSIRESGLLHAITLRRDGERLVLVAGKRRLEALKYLGVGEIRARILDIDEVHSKLIEIDENLQRAELTELQRSQHLAERKKIWESLYPQTKQGAAPKKGMGVGRKKKKTEANSLNKEANLASLFPVDTPMYDGVQPSLHEPPPLLPNGPQTAPDPQPSPPVPSFTQATAAATQTSERTVKRSTQIGQHICRAAQDLLEGTEIEDKQQELLKIARIKDVDEQVRIAQLIHDGAATSVNRAVKLLQKAKIDAEPQLLPEGPFRVIVIDPPWHYHNGEGHPNHRANAPYASMRQEEILDLDIKSRAADDAFLWLWTTNAHLQDAFALVKHWGFTYKTMLTWDKVHMGTGDWLRGQTEHCLLCVVGKPTRHLTNETTIIREPSTKHSRKPEAFYALVERLCPGAKVELFARQPREGWSVWGLEATGPHQKEGAEHALST